MSGETGGTDELVERLEKIADEFSDKSRDLRNDDATRRGHIFAAELIKREVIKPVEAALTSLRAEREHLQQKLENLESGATAILPHTHEHALNLYTIALACLKQHGTNPESSLAAEVAELTAISEAAIAALEKRVAALVVALKRLILAYVNLLEIGRDHIVSLGGQCDPVDVMEAGDPALREAKAALPASEA